MNLIPPQSSASLPEADSARASTDSARTALLDALNELLEAEREEHAHRLALLLALTHQATPPGNACRTWIQLCTATRRFAEDLQEHIRLENRVLFPQFDKSLTQERPEAVR